VRDIDCARAFGARVIAVATGTASPVDLEAAEPDLLLEDLSDLSAALSGIERLVSSSDHW
jgi:phosphoglycolate phosphatase-like HAD superfamily hydrolase